VVGWDGTVYPWAFPIRNFQPRVSSVHLPPTWHGTFDAGGALICSFVPRPLDFHPEAGPPPSTTQRGQRSIWRSHRTAW
jgi:homogentisate 1,2-dioxygenase